jgi:hypothetical protein
VKGQGTLPKRQAPDWEDAYNRARLGVVRQEDNTLIFCAREKSKSAEVIREALINSGIDPEKLQEEYYLDLERKYQRQRTLELEGEDPYIAKALARGKEEAPKEEPSAPKEEPSAPKERSSTLPPGFGFGKIDVQAIENEKRDMLESIPKEDKE